MMRHLEWVFVVVPGAAVVAEAHRIAGAEHAVAPEPCSRCRVAAGLVVKRELAIWRRENAR